MKILQKSIVLGVFFTLNAAQAFSENYESFACKEFNQQTQTWGTLVVKVALGEGYRRTDYTQIVTPEKVLKFYSMYNHEKSPHYRWGYSEILTGKLVHPGMGGFYGTLEINIEHQGPTLKPEGEPGYIVRGIRGFLEVFDQETGQGKFISLVCQSTL